GVAAVLGDRGLAVGDQAHAVAAFLEETLDHQLVYRIVLGDQDAGRLAVAAAHFAQQRRDRRAWFLVEFAERLAQGIDRYRLGQVLQAQALSDRQLPAGLGWADQQHALLQLQLGPQGVQPVVDAARPGRHQYQ